MRIVTVRERESGRQGGGGEEEKGRGNRVNYEAKQISLVTTASEGAQGGGVGGRSVAKGALSLSQLYTKERQHRDSSGICAGRGKGGGEGGE